MTFEEKMDFTRRMVDKMEELYKRSQSEEFLGIDETEKLTDEMMTFYRDYIYGMSYEIAKITEKVNENNRLLVEINEKLK